MKLFWVILRGFLTIWVLLAATLIAVLLMVTDPLSAMLLGGVAATLMSGVAVYFIVRSRVRVIEKSHPELKKRR